MLILSYICFVKIKKKSIFAMFLNQVHLTLRYYDKA